MEWVNYHHLLYFWVVAKEGSLAAASEYRREQFSVLLTVAALVDEVTQDGRTLASLADVPFD